VLLEPRHATTVIARSLTAVGIVSSLKSTRRRAAGRRYLFVRFLAAEVLVVAFFFAVDFGCRRSGRTFLPVERFHSSYCSSVILPSTSSSANFRRCALLLKGINHRLRDEPPRECRGTTYLRDPLA